MSQPISMLLAVETIGVEIPRTSRIFTFLSQSQLFVHMLLMERSWIRHRCVLERTYVPVGVETDVIFKCTFSLSSELLNGCMEHTRAGMVVRLVH